MKKVFIIALQMSMSDKKIIGTKSETIFLQGNSFLVPIIIKDIDGDKENAYYHFETEDQAVEMANKHELTEFYIITKYIKEN